MEASMDVALSVLFNGHADKRDTRTHTFIDVCVCV